MGSFSALSVFWRCPSCLREVKQFVAEEISRIQAETNLGFFGEAPGSGKWPCAALHQAGDAEEAEEAVEAVEAEAGEEPAELGCGKAQAEKCAVSGRRGAGGGGGKRGGGALNYHFMHMELRAVPGHRRPRPKSPQRRRSRAAPSVRRRRRPRRPRRQTPSGPKELQRP